MKRFKTPLTLLTAWMAAFPGKSIAMPAEGGPPLISNDDLAPVNLQPLNRPGDNLFAAHRSHSSHRSHASSSGGGSSYRVPATPQPAPSQPPSNDKSQFYGSGQNSPTDPGRPSQVSPQPTQPTPPPALSKNEKLKLQVMRVQIALAGLGLYQGVVDGVLNEDTKTSLKLFQNLKGLEQSGLMSTETLNALGVPAVQ